MSSTRGSTPRSAGPQLATSALEAELEDLRRILESNVPLAAPIPPHRAWLADEAGVRSLPGSRGSPRGKDSGRGAVTSHHTPRISLADAPAGEREKVTLHRTSLLNREAVKRRSPSPLGESSLRAGGFRNVLYPQGARSAEKPGNKPAMQESFEMSGHSEASSPKSISFERSGQRLSHQNSRATSPDKSDKEEPSRPPSLLGEGRMNPKRDLLPESSSSTQSEGDYRNEYSREQSLSPSTRGTSPPQGRQGVNRQLVERSSHEGSHRSSGVERSAGGTSDGGSVDHALGNAEGLVSLALRRTNATATKQQQELLDALAAKDAEVQRLLSELTAARSELESQSTTTESALAMKDAKLRAAQAELSLANQKLAEQAMARGQEPQSQYLELQESLKAAEAELAHAEAALLKEQELRTGAEHVARQLDNKLAEASRSLQEEGQRCKKALHKAEKERKRRKQAEALLAQLQSKGTGAQVQSHLDERQQGDQAQPLEGKKPAAKEQEIQGGKDSRKEGGVDIGALESALAAERKSREAAERWLRAELRHKAEMEQLFAALRDIALAKSSGVEATELRSILEELRAEQKDVFKTTRSSWDAAVVGKRAPLSTMQHPQAKKAPPVAKRLGVKRASAPVVMRRFKGSENGSPLGKLIVLTRCQHCGQRFDANSTNGTPCGYHPGELSLGGYTCCGALPQKGREPVFCQWGQHVSK